MKKFIFTLIVINTSMLAIAQTAYQEAKVKPLNRTEIKNSYALRNDEDKYMTSELIEFTPVTDYDITNDFLSDIATVLESANVLKPKVNDSGELETLNRSIFLLKKLQYNMVSTNEIIYYNAVMKHVNYSNIVNIDTLTIRLDIAYYGVTGGYEKNRLKWLGVHPYKQDLINSYHRKERVKLKEILSDVEHIQEKEKIREMEKNNKTANVIYDNVKIKPEFIGGAKKLNEEIKKTEETIGEIPLYNGADIQVAPEFPGGMREFYQYISKNFQVPDEEGLKGKIYVTFIVEIDGSLTDIKVLRDIGYGTGKEAIRVLNKCPKWIAGEINGKKVRCTFSVPINIS